MNVFFQIVVVEHVLFCGFTLLIASNSMAEQQSERVKCNNLYRRNGNASQSQQLSIVGNKIIGICR